MHGDCGNSRGSGRLAPYDYVHCIDDDDLEAWPSLFASPCLYKIVPRENADLNLPIAIMYCDSQGMLQDRVTAHRKANLYGAHFIAIW